MRALFGIAILACAACSDDPPDDEVREEQAIAAVKAANDIEPPFEQITPQPLLQSEIERHDIFGTSCAYAPGTNLGTRVIARQADAFMKVDDEVLRFAADPGSRELAQGTRSLYNGREFSLRLELEGGEAQLEGEAAELEGTVHLLDRWGREIYGGTGPVRCEG